MPDDLMQEDDVASFSNNQFVDRCALLVAARTLA
jgi:hypothetical protein